MIENYSKSHLVLSNLDLNFTSFNWFLTASLHQMSGVYKLLKPAAPVFMLQRKLVILCEFVPVDELSKNI